tara:strand:+ start:44073 stop:45494 length:1422 start_codon:yes stop_codon:yes gene_type:complete
MTSTVFRKYDIRGIFDKDLTEKVVYQIGLAVGSIIAGNLNNDNKIIIGQDARISSPVVFSNLTKGIIETGVEVYDIGIVPTPVLYHYVETNNFLNGIMITGSHNSAEYNGLKIIINGNSYSGENISSIYNKIKNQDYIKANNKAKITSKYQALDHYLQDITTNFFKITQKNKFKRLTVVVDSGNSVAGVIVPKVLKTLGCKVIELYSELDGSFPNHHPDPAKLENLKDLQQMVLNKNADLGLAFDGDADRLGVITNKAEVVWPDKLIMLFAKDLLSKKPNSKIIYDVKCSRNLEKVIKKYNGIPIMYCTGHSLIKAKMRKTGALLAGEMSGHIFFKDNWYGFDDAIYSAIKLLEILVNTKEYQNLSLHDVMQEFDDGSVSTQEINIQVNDSDKNKIVNKIIESCKFEKSNKITIDGLRVEYKNGWGLVRASNTTPSLGFRFEAENKEELYKIRDLFQQELKEAIPDLQLNLDI